MQLIPSSLVNVSHASLSSYKLTQFQCIIAQHKEYFVFSQVMHRVPPLKESLDLERFGNICGSF